MWTLVPVWWAVPRESQGQALPGWRGCRSVVQVPLRPAREGSLLSHSICCGGHGKSGCVTSEG